MGRTHEPAELDDREPDTGEEAGFEFGIARRIRHSEYPVAPGLKPYP